MGDLKVSDKKHGNTGKQNRMIGDKPKSSFIQIRCTQEEKAAIVRQLSDNEKLSEFMLKAASIEVKKRIERKVK